MKNIIFLILVTTLYSLSSQAANHVFSCEKSFLGNTYEAKIEISTTTENSSIFMVASNNRATKRGEQSQGPVGKQKFNTTLIADQDGTYEVISPIDGTSYRKNSTTDFTKIIATKKSDSTYKIAVYGNALKHHNPFTFGKITLNCDELNY